MVNRNIMCPGKIKYLFPVTLPSNKQEPLKMCVLFLVSQGCVYGPEHSVSVFPVVTQ